MKTLCWGYGIGLVFGQSGIQVYFIKRTTKRGKDRGFRISGICLQNLLGSGIEKKIFPGSEKMKIFSGLQGTRTVPVSGSYYEDIQEMHFQKIISGIRDLGVKSSGIP